MREEISPVTCIDCIPSLTSHLFTPTTKTLKLEEITRESGALQWSERRSEIIFIRDPRWFPYAIKNQRGASKIRSLRSKASSRGIWIRRAGSLWHKRAGVATSWKYFSLTNLPTNESRISTLLTNESAPLCNIVFPLTNLHIISSWVLQCLDNVGQDSQCSNPPCAIVPLGTGRTHLSISPLTWLSL